MQRTDLCFNSAYREALLRDNAVLLRAILLVILVQMIGLALFVRFGIGGVSLNVVPFFWLAAIVGGFVFGVAMVYPSTALRPFDGAQDRRGSGQGSGHRLVSLATLDRDLR